MSSWNTHKQSGVKLERLHLYITVSRCEQLCRGIGRKKACLLSKPSLDKYSNTHRHTLSHYVLNGSFWLYFPALRWGKACLLKTTGLWFQHCFVCRGVMESDLSLAGWNSSLFQKIWCTVWGGRMENCSNEEQVKYTVSYSSFSILSYMFSVTCWHCVYVCVFLCRCGSAYGRLQYSIHSWVADPSWSQHTLSKSWWKLCCNLTWLHHKGWAEFYSQAKNPEW